MEYVDVTSIEAFRPKQVFLNHLLFTFKWYANSSVCILIVKPYTGSYATVISVYIKYYSNAELHE